MTAFLDLWGIDPVHSARRAFGCLDWIGSVWAVMGMRDEKCIVMRGLVCA